MDLREVIARELERRGWPQTKLCERTGLTPARVNDYLKGKRDMLGGNLDRILKALGLAVTRRRKR
ncbi:MAG: helix-turn-helix transcriptional regulator [Phycisphaeraceae bacterium]|nr:helix-turn-helix transcriptional regulator [Phycisphaeraceae bacterium]